MAGDPRSKAAELRRQAAAIEGAMGDADRVALLVTAYQEARQSAHRAAERAARAGEAAKTARLAAEASRQSVVTALREHLHRGLPPSLAEGVFGVSAAIVASAREDREETAGSGALGFDTGDSGAAIRMTGDEEPGESPPSVAEVRSA